MTTWQVVGFCVQLYLMVGACMALSVMLNAVGLYNEFKHTDKETKRPTLLVSFGRIVLFWPVIVYVLAKGAPPKPKGEGDGEE